MTSLTTSKSSLVIGKLVEPSAKSKSWKQSSGSGCVSSSNAHKLKTRHKTDNNQVVILLVEHCIAFYQFWKLQQSSALKWLLFWRCRNFCQTIKVLPIRRSDNINSVTKRFKFQTGNVSLFPRLFYFLLLRTLVNYIFLVYYHYL